MAKDAKKSQKAAQKRRERELKRRKERAAQAGGGESRVSSFAIGECPIVECEISQGWQERGLAHILLVRRQPDERILVAGYYVDIFCLGLKDTAILRDLNEEEYRSNLRENIFNDPVELIPCEPALAKAVVEGAIAFAEPFGFHPNKRWLQSKKAFTGVEEPAAPPVFGVEGKPCFVDRGETNAASIIARLERKAGAGGFLVREEAEEEAE